MADEKRQEEVYGLTAAQSNRIFRAVKRVESLPLPKTPGDVDYPKITPEVQPVAVTSCCETDGRFPGNVLQYDSASNSFVTLADCWVIELNASPLAPGRYDARRIGVFMDKPVYMTWLPVVDPSLCGCCSISGSTSSSACVTPHFPGYGTGLTADVDIWTYECVDGHLMGMKRTEHYVNGLLVEVT